MKEEQKMQEQFQIAHITQKKEQKLPDLVKVNCWLAVNNYGLGYKLSDGTLG
jgi:hypothetical protein